MTRFAYMRYAGQGHEIRVRPARFPDALPTPSTRSGPLRGGLPAQVRLYHDAGAPVEAVDWYVVATLANAGAGRNGARSWKGQASAGRSARGTRKA